MLLAIDIGNTNVTLGVFEGEEVRSDWRLRSSRHSSKDEVGMSLMGLFQYAGLKVADLRGVCLASVVPPLTGTYVQACLQYLRITPLVVETGVKTGVKVQVTEPRSVGADRIVNACAVKALVNGPAIVVDFGTATTFDAVDRHGNYIGGAIAPGLEVAVDSLSGRTAKLPRVELVVPPRAIGKSTIEAIRSGVLFGYVSLVEGMIARISAEMAEEEGGECTVVATGGLAPTIAGLTSVIHRVEPNLTLEGLRLIWNLNRA
ncbi:MAG TPA: type III pantothenate kinase [Phycisphaerales bacterium]|nr:type III pantothenate kinase [Phycisphaerales bacterium]